MTHGHPEVWLLIISISRDKAGAMLSVLASYLILGVVHGCNIYLSLMTHVFIQCDREGDLFFLEYDSSAPWHLIHKQSPLHPYLMISPCKDREILVPC
jgi:hypothetical protein